MEQDTDIVNVDFKALFKRLKKEKWLIIGITTFFTILGVFYAFSLKEEFVSEGKILPEVSSKADGLGQYAGLAALAGVDIGSVGGNSDAISPQLYPDVLQSKPYFLDLFNQKIKDKNNKEWIFKDFYFNQILDGKVKAEDQKLNYPKSNQYVIFNKQTEKNIKDLKKRIVCNYDRKTGMITISAKMPDPVVAANIAAYSMDYLTNYIIEYRTQKQKRDLDFLAERLSAAKGKYFLTQSKKASYIDQMPLSALRLQSADLQRERIDAEYKISSSFYNTLLQKYEESKLQIQQETPIIKILDPPGVPNYKSSPIRSLIICSSVFFGFIVSLLFCYIFR